MPNKKPRKEIFGIFEKRISDSIKKETGGASIHEVVRRVHDVISKILDKGEKIDKDKVDYKISPAQMYRYLSGKAPIPLLVLGALAKSFGFSIDSLCDSSDSSNTIEVSKSKEIEVMTKRLKGVFEEYADDKKDNEYFLYYCSQHQNDLDAKNKLMQAFWRVKEINKVTLIPPPPKSANHPKQREYHGEIIITPDNKMIARFDNEDRIDYIDVCFNFSERSFTFALGHMDSIRRLDDGDNDHAHTFQRCCLVNRPLSEQGAKIILKLLDVKEDVVGKSLGKISTMISEDLIEMNVTGCLKLPSMDGTIYRILEKCSEWYLSDEKKHERVNGIKKLNEKYEVVETLPSIGG